MAFSSLEFANYRGEPTGYATSRNLFSALRLATLIMGQVAGS